MKRLNSLITAAAAALVLASTAAPPSHAASLAPHATSAVDVIDRVEAAPQDHDLEWKVWDYKIYKSRESCRNFFIYYLQPHYSDIVDWRCIYRFQPVFPYNYGVMLEVKRP